MSQKPGAKDEMLRWLQIAEELEDIRERFGSGPLGGCCWMRSRAVDGLAAGVGPVRQSDDWPAC